MVVQNTSAKLVISDRKENLRLNTKTFDGAKPITSLESGEVPKIEMIEKTASFNGCPRENSTLDIKEKPCPSTELIVSSGNEINQQNAETVVKKQPNTIDGEGQVQTKVKVPKATTETKTFSCHHCPFVTSNQTKFKSHLKYKHTLYCKICQQNTHGYHKHCKWCSFVSVQRGSLKTHKRELHQSSFECKTCLKVLKGRSSLVSHTNLVHLGIQFNCDKCPMSYGSKKDLEVHTLLDTFDNIDSGCKKCGKSDPPQSKRSLRIHMVKEHEQPAYPCNLCSNIYFFKSHLKEHMKRHTDDSKIHSCSMCDFKTLLKQILKKHKLKAHKKDRTNIDRECPVCDLQVNQKLYKAHYSTHLKLCNKCNFKSVSLVKHMRKHDGVKCNTCQKVISLVNLLYHQKSIHGVFDMEKDIHQCDLCEWRFATAKGLKGHQMMVHENQQFQCQKCEFKAPKRSRIASHQKTHEREDLTCRLCDFKSPFEKVLNIHRIRIHEGYSCKTCERKFTNLNSLRNHELSHGSLKCKDCEFVALTRRRLAFHAYIHTEMKCDICTKSFLRPTRFHKHKLSHTKFTCTICGIFKKNQLAFEKHKYAKHAFRKCEQCEFEGANHKVNIHQGLVHATKALLSCKFCDYTANKKGDMKRHGMLEHVMTLCRKCCFKGNKKEIKAHRRNS